jgi:hypothetical protein
MASKWYYSRQGQTYGPILGTELRQLAAAGTIQPTDLVWREDWKEWKAASIIKELFTQSSVSASPVSSPLPADRPIPSESISTPCPCCKTQVNVLGGDNVECPSCRKHFAPNGAATNKAVFLSNDPSALSAEGPHESKKKPVILVLIVFNWTFLGVALLVEGIMSTVSLFSMPQWLRLEMSWDHSDPVLRVGMQQLLRTSWDSWLWLPFTLGFKPSLRLMGCGPSKHGPPVMRKGWPSYSNV